MVRRLRIMKIRGRIPTLCRDRGGIPAAGLVDGKGVNYLKYFEFDLGSPSAPGSYTPLP